MNSDTNENMNGTGTQPSAKPGSPANGRADKPRIYTIGHSNLPAEQLLDLLRSAGIQVVVDVRTHPGSKRFPQYNRGVLAASLVHSGFRYIWLGNKIGGKRAEPKFLTADGGIDLGKVIASPDFQGGLQELLALAGESTIALLCAEEDPYQCHRTWLICRGLQDAPVEILHIRKAGQIEPHQPERSKDREQSLFDL